MSRRTAERLGLLVLLIVLAAVLASATLVDRVPPTVDRIFVSRTAGSGGLALTHAAVGVQFSEAVRRPGAELRFHLDPDVPGAFSWSDDRTLIYTPSQKLPNSIHFSVTEQAGYQDLAGNAAKEPSRTFSFTTVGPPIVMATTPAAGATGVALGATIAVTFDRLMDTQRTAAAVKLQPAAAVQASWSGQTLSLVPHAPLLPDTLYRLIVAGGATDTDGNGLGAPLEIDFRTLQVGLAIGSVLPADGSAGIALGAPIGVVFGGPVDPASIAGSLSITPAVGGTTVLAVLPADPLPSPAASPSPSPTSGGAPSPSPTSGLQPSPSPTEPPSSSPAPGGTASPTSLGPGGSLVLFQPSQPLAPSTTYTVTLEPGVVRGLGSDLAAPGRSWTFTTGGPPEPVQNQILFRSPRSGVRNVWAMNPDGTGARQLTTELAPITAFDVSGDGKTLAYSAGGVVRIMSLPSGQVTTVTDPGDAEYAPRLLPDGSAVIVGRRDRASGADEGWWELPLSGGSGSVRQLLPDGAPPLGSAAADPALPLGPVGPWTTVEAVSADGHLALLPQADGALVLVSLVAGPAGQPAAGAVIATGLGPAAGPAAWSAALDGFVVAATRASDPQSQVWVVQGDGSLVAGPALVAWSSVATNGAIAALTAPTTGHLAVAAGTGAAPQALTTASDLADREPAFGPGPGAIVFVRVATTSPGESAGIWTVGADGRDLRQLSTDGTDPRWLP